MINNLPNGWRIEELGKLCDFINGFAFKSSDYVDNSNTVSIRMSNIRPNASFDYTHNIRYLPDDFAEKYNQYILDDGDIIVAMTDMGQAMNILGVPTIVKKSKNLNFLLNQRVGKLFNFDRNKILVDYIKIFMSTDYIHNFYKQLGGGGLQINLSKKDLLSALVLIPPLQQQEKIVKVLDLSSNLIEKQKELLKNYDLFLKSKFIEMFGEPSKNVMNWNMEKFEKYIEYIGDIGSNGSNAVISKNLKMLDTEDYALMIRTTNLNKNDFINDVKYVSEETYNFFKKSKIFGGEIIMNKIGSAGKFWKMPYLNKPVSLGLNQLVIRLKNLNTEYLYYLLSTEYGQLVISSKTNGAVTQSITKGAVKDIDIMIPPIELQNKFASIVERIEIIKEKENQKLKQLENLHNSLMQKAFKGEIK